MSGGTATACVEELSCWYQKSGNKGKEPEKQRCRGHCN
jgi:hypothetical protein